MNHPPSDTPAADATPNLVPQHLDATLSILTAETNDSLETTRTAARFDPATDIMETPSWLLHRLAEHQEQFEAHLAPYALRSSQTLGRRYPEPVFAEVSLAPAPYARDRERVVQAQSFRRLLGKTQVFVNLRDDYGRNRLTHTLEVVQLARLVARVLGLNEQLTETIALAHDIGHPPFGHIGERKLQRLMADDGGFEHNRQGLRLVESVERRYPDFPGLNLTWEVRQAFALHSPEPEHPEVQPYLAHRPNLPSLSESQQVPAGTPLDRTVAEVAAQASAKPGMFGECQVVDLADNIAYTVHDLDDALRYELITPAELSTELSLWREAAVAVGHHYGAAATGKMQIRAMLRWLTHRQIMDLCECSRQRLNGISSAGDIQFAADPPITFSTAMQEQKAELYQFLFQRVYRHPEVMRATQVGAAVLDDLFQLCQREPNRLPPPFQKLLIEFPLTRVVCDFVSGMTDRFAFQLHRQWCQ